MLEHLSIPSISIQSLFWKSQRLFYIFTIFMIYALSADSLYCQFHMSWPVSIISNGSYF